MVMLNRSLRAVFRKESWMFCAGLPLSIADVLRFSDSQHTNSPLPQTRGTRKPTACPSRTSRLKEHGGTTCLLAASVPQDGAAWQVAVSTIRCPRALFNPELAECQSSIEMSP